MTTETRAAQAQTVQDALASIVRRVDADTGTVHFLGSDGLLHLCAATPDLPATTLAAIRTIPVGKGMAGLAVERRRPVDACNIQTDESGDVRPGARATGLSGAVVVPIFRDAEVVGALGVATRSERRFSEAETGTLIEAGRMLAERAATLVAG
jgi:L-methionine (R)-S-oxide reductase